MSQLCWQKASRYQQDIQKREAKKREAKNQEAESGMEEGATLYIKVKVGKAGEKIGYFQYDCTTAHHTTNRSEFLEGENMSHRDTIALNRYAN